THDSAQDYGLICLGGRVDSCCTHSPGQPDANNRPPETATATSASDTSGSANRRSITDEDEEDIADWSVAEDRTTDPRQDRWIFSDIRRCMSDVREIGDTGQQE
ncbi:hypothetical protein, partial [Pseudonocardia sp. EV170527-09]|uniref:hypothetical protein n=1 Tax=Pseudonocardia sp. EV170527-09 TaxID=2603411 RepID=UPI00195FB060